MVFSLQDTLRFFLSMRLFFFLNGVKMKGDFKKAFNFSVAPTVD